MDFPRRLQTWQNGTWSAAKGGRERGKDYNHSTYNDLIISGLIGLRPQADETIIVNPLLPQDAWDWFCLGSVRYHGKILNIIWDKNGTRYGKGKGFRLYVDGQLACCTETLQEPLGGLL